MMSSIIGAMPVPRDNSKSDYFVVHRNLHVTRNPSRQYKEAPHNPLYKD